MFLNSFDYIKITVLRLDRPTVVPFCHGLNIAIGINICWHSQYILLLLYFILLGRLAIPK